MLSNLTWKDYAELLITLTVIYYLIIGFIYYRKDLGRLASARLSAKNRASNAENKEPAGEVTEIANPYYTPTIDELEELLSDIKTNILERAGISAGKAALLTELKARLANYDGLRQPAYQDALNGYITQHAKELCGVTFSEDELKEEWKKLPR